MESLLSLLIWLPIVGGISVLVIGNNRSDLARWVSVAVSIIVFSLSLNLWNGFDTSTQGMQFVENTAWISQFNINYHIGIDGISMLLILLTTLSTFLVIIAGWEVIQNRAADYMAAFLIMEGLIIGVFSSLDAILFYVFWEASLIPMLLIVGIWGGQNRVYAAIKFFLYTFLGSVFMLVSLIYMYIQGGSFSLDVLNELPLSLTEQSWIFWAFFLAFAVKVPMFPVHTWLPDAHVEAPTAGSVILAAILLKMAGYGFIRFSLGLFPDASLYFVPLVYTLSLIAIIYTSLVALMQEDMKKLIAYSSVAHMGFVTLGIFTMTQQGIEGSIFQMISHGLVSAALFLCVGVVYDRLHTRLINRYGGLVSIMPKYAIVFMVFTLGALGLPGTSGFIGEFLVLMGAFKKNILVATIASLGVILGAAYMLWLYKRIIFGKLINEDVKKMVDLKRFEIVTLWLLVLPIIFFGFYPEPLINSIEVSVANMIDMNDLGKINKLALGE